MNASPDRGSPIQILLVEDNPGDVFLTVNSLRDSKVRNEIRVAEDGAKALAFLRRQGEFAEVPRPDLILLDLNLPQVSGHEVLAAIKADPELKRIPVVILSSSQCEEDILKSYDRYANCFITKPVDLDQFMKVVQTIEGFWLTVVKLP